MGKIEQLRSSGHWVSGSVHSVQEHQLLNVKISSCSQIIFFSVLLVWTGKNFAFSLQM